MILALVMFNDVRTLPLDQLGSPSGFKLRPLEMAIHDRVGASDKPLFVPRLAFTSLPLLCADVAKVGPTVTG